MEVKAISFCLGSHFNENFRIHEVDTKLNPEHQMKSDEQGKLTGGYTL